MQQVKVLLSGGSFCCVPEVTQTTNDRQHEFVLMIIFVLVK